MRRTRPRMRFQSLRRVRTVTETLRHRDPSGLSPRRITDPTVVTGRDVAILLVTPFPESLQRATQGGYVPYRTGPGRAPEVEIRFWPVT